MSQLWIPARDCIGITFVPSSYTFDDITDPDFPKKSGYHIRLGPTLEQSSYSETTYLRELIPEITTKQPTYTGSERIVSEFIMCLKKVTKIGVTNQFFETLKALNFILYHRIFRLKTKRGSELFHHQSHMGPNGKMTITMSVFITLKELYKDSLQLFQHLCSVNSCVRLWTMLSNRQFFARFDP